MRRLPGGKLLLEELELVGVFEGVVAADGNQGVHLQRDQGVVDGPQRRHPRGVLQVGAVRHVLAGIGPRGADDDALAVAGAAQHLVVDVDVIAALDHGMIGPELDQVRVAVEDAQHVDVVPQERDGGGGNHGVGGRRGSAGEQNRGAANVRFQVWRPGQSAAHGNLPSLFSYLSRNISSRGSARSAR